MSGARIEVDALALMLDGAVTPIGRYKRKSVFWLEMLGTESVLYHRSREWPDVAQAILELEAWADWWQYETEDDAPFRLSPLARAAHTRARGYASDQILLEAAALLRDGWRP